MIIRILFSFIFAVLLNWIVGLQFAIQVEKNERTRIIMTILAMFLAFIGAFILYG